MSLDDFPTIEPLSLPLAQQLLMVSYHLSQGSDPLQSYLLAAVAYKRPQWQLRFQQCDLLEERLAPAIMGLCERGLHQPLTEEQIRSDLHKQLQELHRRLLLPQSAFVRHTPYLLSLVSRLITRDADFLQKEQGRPRRLAEASPLLHPRRDPYVSHLCHYVLLGHSTGCQVFDEILAEIRDGIVAEERWWKRIRKQHAAELRLILRVYTHHHPQTPIPLEIARLLMPPAGRKEEHEHAPC